MRLDEVLADKELPLASKAAYILILKRPEGAEFHHIKEDCRDKPSDILYALKRLMPKYVTSNGVVWRVKDE